MSLAGPLGGYVNSYVGWSSSAISWSGSKSYVLSGPVGSRAVSGGGGGGGGVYRYLPFASLVGYFQSNGGGGPRTADCDV